MQSTTRFQSDEEKLHNFLLVAEQVGVALTVWARSREVFDSNLS
jgi:hypothetical protein